MAMTFDMAEIHPPAKLEEISEEMLASNPIAEPSNDAAKALIAKTNAEGGKPWIIGRATRDCDAAIR